MKQVFLIKPKVDHRPSGDVPLAEKYLLDTISEPSDMNGWLFEVLSRIFNVVSHLTLTDNGEINELGQLIDHNGEEYIGIEDTYNYKPEKPDEFVTYSVLKKLHSSRNSYEIRFAKKNNRGHWECRIIATPHCELKCLVLTHGFSKNSSLHNYYAMGSANRITSELGKVASCLYTKVNDSSEAEKNTDFYLGEEGERHVVEI